RRGFGGFQRRRGGLGRLHVGGVHPVDVDGVGGGGLLQLVGEVLRCFGLGRRAPATRLRRRLARLRGQFAAFTARAEEERAGPDDDGGDEDDKKNLACIHSASNCAAIYLRLQTSYGKCLR